VGKAALAAHGIGGQDFETIAWLTCEEERRAGRDVRGRLSSERSALACD
jgi:hypothetical protein